MDVEKATTGQLMRLDSIAQHLGLASHPDEPSFAPEAVQAVLAKVKPVVDASRAKRGEGVIAAIAASHGVTFEEVRSSKDVADVKRRYLKEQGELGFGMIDDELANPHVDALLFQLTQVPVHDPNRFVAVLNLQESSSRAYWNRSHELGHRLAEPPQKLLPFKRHRFEAADPVERLVDQIAGEIAFYAPLFRPVVRRMAKNRDLTLSLVGRIQADFAPTASLLAIINAVVKHWPHPAIALEACQRGRKNQPSEDLALRVKVQARNAAARESNLLVWDNMRVPSTSPLFSAFSEDRQCEGCESLEEWSTSKGRKLSARRVLTSAIGLKNRAYAIISMQQS